MTCDERPIFLGDLVLSRFTCVGDKIEPSVATNASLSGTGSTANPLNVVTLVVGEGDPCGDIGAAFMVRAVTVDPVLNELQIDSAPEHTSAFDSSARSAGPGPNAINNGQTETTGDHDRTINNPSACRSLVVHDHIVATFDVDLRDSGVWTYEILIGGFVSATRVFTAPALGPFWSGHLEIIVFNQAIIAAGASLMRTFEARIVNTGADTSGLSVSRTIGINVLSSYTTQI